MAKGLLIVLTKPSSEDREEEFNEWYDDTHLVDLVNVPGVTSASRYKLADAQVVEGASLGNPYLAIYELEGDDLSQVTAAINGAASDGRFRMSDSIDRGTGQSVVFELITAPVTEASLAASG